MLRYNLFLVLLLVSLNGEEGNLTTSDLNTSEFKKIEKLFQDALQDFKYGSYYQALDEFLEVAKYPTGKYFLNSLYMLASTYLYIGKRTGDKKYLWSALNYLNLYLAKGGKESSEFYYLKGYIYENLGFYEKALANYKLALEVAKDKKEKLKVAIGLLRAAIMSGKLDTASHYLEILEVEKLTPKQRKELQFLKGLYHFANKNYPKAIEFFKNSYRENEEYLIENPQYYYIVAETAYRLGDLNFSQYLFRRILTYVKSQEILQKTLLRLGDLQFKKGNYKSAADYYIRLIKTYPNSQNALVAKLKLLYLIKQDPKLGFFVKKYMGDLFKEPQKFVIETLVSYRTSYPGIFALANFGLETLELNSKKLFKRLEWELSLLSPNRLHFEQQEYFKRLWSPYLVKEEKAKEICSLYLSNPQFFKEVFEKGTLLRIASFLAKCQKEKERIKLLEELAKETPNSKILLELAKAYFEQKEYLKAIETLKRVKKRDCEYYKLFSKVCFLANKECVKIYKGLIKNCKKEKLYSALFQTYLNMRKNKLSTVLLKDKLHLIAQAYNSDPVVKKFVELFAKKLLEKERYEELVEFLNPLAKTIESDCFLNSLLALSYVRVGKIEFARNLLENIGNCEKDRWFKLAQLALQDALLQEKIKDF